jgi:hypothetical protein
VWHIRGPFGNDIRCRPGCLNGVTHPVSSVDGCQSSLPRQRSGSRSCESRGRTWPISYLTNAPICPRPSHTESQTVSATDYLESRCKLGLEWDCWGCSDQPRDRNSRNCRLLVDSGEGQDARVLRTGTAARCSCNGCWCCLAPRANTRADYLQVLPRFPECPSRRPLQRSHRRPDCASRSSSVSTLSTAPSSLNADARSQSLRPPMPWCQRLLGPWARRKPAITSISRVDESPAVTSRELRQSTERNGYRMPASVRAEANAPLHRSSLEKECRTARHGDLRARVILRGKSQRERQRLCPVSGRASAAALTPVISGNRLLDRTG